MDGFNFLVPFHEEFFEYVHTIDEADVVPMFLFLDETNPNSVEWIVKFMSDRMRLGQTLIGIDHLQHIGEGTSDVERLCRQATLLHELAMQVPAKRRPHVICAHTNSAIQHHHSLPYNLMYTDFLWNRHQTFYVTQPDCIFNATQDANARNHWYPSITGEGLSKEIYALSDLDKAFNQQRWSTQIFRDDNVPRLFLSPNKARDISKLMSSHSGYLPMPHLAENHYGIRDWLRVQLIKKLQDYPGFIGNPSSGNILLGQGADEAQLYGQISNNAPLGWTPIHNSYYDNSAISIYVETLCLSDADSECVTEKTWEPLIKGHMILPFSYCGFVDNLVKQYGMLLPDEIDYSYDKITNDLERWAAYTIVVQDLLNKGPDNLFRIKRDNLANIKHNRTLFLRTGYRSSLGKQLAEWINHHVEAAE